MTEIRTYWWLRASLLGIGLGLIGGLLWLSIRQVFFVMALLRVQTPDCGCTAAPTLGWSLWATSGILVALTVIIVTRWLIAFFRQLHRQNTFLAESLRQGRWTSHPAVTKEFLLVDDDRPQALTVGLRRPVIVVTTELVSTLATDEYAAVLRHEQAHAQRFDPWWSMVLEATSFAWWRLPWFQTWLESIWRLRELTADAVATENYAHADGLGGAILKLSTTDGLQPTPGFSPNQDRVEKLLDHNWRPRLPLWRWGFVASAGVIILGLFFFTKLTMVTAAERQPASAGSCHQVPTICRAPATTTSQSTLCWPAGWQCLSLFPARSQSLPASYER